MRPFKGSYKLYPERHCNICSNLHKKYAITGPIRDALLVEQGNACKICKNPIHVKTHGHTAADAAVVDHCHSTGKVRGILCGKCNIGLGHFRDNVETMEMAIKYIQETDV